MQTGTGKSPTALTAVRKAGCHKVLIVCPAMVRLTWLREIERWWPAVSKVAYAITAGRNRRLGKKKASERDAAYMAPVQVVSYDLLHEVDEQGWDAIIFDEAHNLKSSTSRQSKRAYKLVKHNPGVMCLALTATLAPNDVADVWNVCDTLWPQRFGKPNQTRTKIPFSFANRYTDLSHNGFGYVYKGVNRQHAEELRYRLARVSSQVTHEEVADQLPPFQVRTLYTRDDPVTYALGWVDALPQEEPPPSHVVVFTHFKSTARTLSKYLFERHGGAIRVVTVTGEQTPEERMQRIQLWGGPTAGASMSFLVTTMHSCGIGINGLEVAQRALFAELYSRPETMLQAMGRFNRLSSTHPASVDLVVREGSQAEKTAEQLLKKMDGIGRVLRRTGSHSKLTEAFEAGGRPDEALMAELRALVPRSEDDEVDDGLRD